MQKFTDPNVEQIFKSFRGIQSKMLLNLREMIFKVSKTDSKIGPLSEELRWGEPSYITKKSNSGSAVRLGVFGKDKSKVAVFFHCKTSLVYTFHAQFGDLFEYSKNRAIVLDPKKPITQEQQRALRSCVHASLTYKLQDSKNIKFKNFD